MALYDSIGKGYAKTRGADPRIAGRLIELLDLPPDATVLDVGAGTGKYARALANHGFKVIALEPSEVMQSQATPHDSVRFVPACAENMPLPDASADGAIVVLALHHFRDRLKAFEEVLRVVGTGPVVLFTFDPAAFREFWLAEYFPHLGRKFAGSVSLGEIVSEIRQAARRRKVNVLPFPLPRDLQDKFGAASWGQPEAYLDAEVRNGISDFALMPAAEIESGLQKLRDDLATGRWDQAYGALRTLEAYEVGYHFIVVEP
jgi:ubiquinone/menaquinone biosynthesis C-methylase UbiE